MESFGGLGQGKSFYRGHRPHWTARNPPEDQLPNKNANISEGGWEKNPGKRNEEKKIKNKPFWEKDEKIPRRGG